MAAKSDIEWTDASWIPIRARNLKTGKLGWHCEHATTGCKFCYAEGMNKRLGTGLPFKPGHRTGEGRMKSEYETIQEAVICLLTGLWSRWRSLLRQDRLASVFAVCLVAIVVNAIMWPARSHEGGQNAIRSNGLNVTCNGIKLPTSLGNARLLESIFFSGIDRARRDFFSASQKLDLNNSDNPQADGGQYEKKSENRYAVRKQEADKLAQRVLFLLLFLVFGFSGGLLFAWMAGWWR